MAAGRAIVATRVGANARLIRDGKDGLVIPSEDSAALAGAIEHLIHNPPMAAQLGQSARLRAVESFSREAMRQRFEQLYRDLRA